MEGIEILLTGMIAIIIYVIAVKTIKRPTVQFSAVLLIGILQFLVNFGLVERYNTETIPFVWLILVNLLFVILILISGIKAIKNTVDKKIKIAIGSVLIIPITLAMIFLGFMVFGLMFGMT